MKRAVFLDRDGAFIEQRESYDYVGDDLYTASRLIFESHNGEW
jgi:hypothetical protein